MSIHTHFWNYPVTALAYNHSKAWLFSASKGYFHVKDMEKQRDALMPPLVRLVRLSNVVTDNQSKMSSPSHPAPIMKT
jgi:hypothetical protein